LCVKLSSTDPAVAAAARSEALTAALAATKSGLVQQLSSNVEFFKGRLGETEIFIGQAEDAYNKTVSWLVGALSKFGGLVRSVSR
jgi:hypothetical protein